VKDLQTQQGVVFEVLCMRSCWRSMFNVQRGHRHVSDPNAYGFGPKIISLSPIQTGNRKKSSQCPVPTF
jgi:hypothetical protein